MTENNSQSTNIFAQQSQSKLESLSKDLGFDIPVDLAQLPSKGLVYAVEHPFCGSEQVEVKCMTTREEDLITSRALIKKGTVITELLKSCLMNKSVNVDTLLVGDRNALLITIRVSGYGSDYVVEIECPDCSEKFKNTFKLDALTIKRLGTNPDSPNSNQFSYTLPLSGLNIKFKLLTGADEFEITQEAEKKKKVGMQTDNVISRRLFYSIMSVNGETDKNKIARIVSNLRAGDSLALRKHIDSVEPGVDMNQQVTCQHCGAGSEVDVPIGPTFFWPDYGSKG